MQRTPVSDQPLWGFILAGLRLVPSPGRVSLLCVICGLFLGCAAFTARAVEVPEGPNVITSSTSRYLIRIEYPTIGHPAADADISFWAYQQANTFIRGLEDIPDTDPGRFTLTITYTQSRVSARCTSVHFKILVDMGEMQSGTGIATFTYDLRDGHSLTLNEIFDEPAGLLPFFSVFCRADLKERLHDAPPELLAYIEEATAPEPTNFSFFILTPAGITLFFPLNQAGGYPLAEAVVKIPLKSMKRFEPAYVYWSRSAASKRL